MQAKCNDTLSISVHRVLNDDLNEHGTVYGGRIMELIDGEASIAAMRVARTVVVTASMDNVQFLRPFKLQDSMCMEAYVTGVGHRSIEVFVKVIGEHLMTGERFLGFTCFITYVIEDPHKAVPVAGMVPETDEQRTLMAGYEGRRQKRRASRQSEQQIAGAISLDFPWRG